MNKIRKEKLQKKLIEAKRFFCSDKYITSVSLAGHYLEQGRLEECNKLLNKLPTRDDLLSSLVGKLKGKSIYRTLRKIHEDKGVDPLTKLKGLSSLKTHCIIEMQGGNPEYGVLLPVLIEKEEQIISELSLGTVMSAKKLAKNVNKVLTDMSMVPFSVPELEASIDALSDNAQEALEDGIKEKDLVKIFNILGMKQVTAFQQKVKGQE